MTDSAVDVSFLCLQSSVNVSLQHLASPHKAVRPQSMARSLLVHVCHFIRVVHVETCPPIHPDGFRSGSLSEGTLQLALDGLMKQTQYLPIPSWEIVRQPYVSRTGQYLATSNQDEGS